MTAQSTGGTATLLDSNRHNLPPLILHPFAEASGPHKLVASSRASLMLQGLLPAGEATPADLQKTLLDGRYSEIRMLYYVGKDIQRWIEQCMDSIRRSEGQVPAGIQPQSFSSLLIQHTPESVSEKLKKWSVNDFKSIFSRGLGLNALFAEIPQQNTLSEEFVRNYFRYADQMFFAWQSHSVYTQLNATQFKFDLYSSGEYSRLLEQSWE
jgi:hypothetical protein